MYEVSYRLEKLLGIEAALLVYYGTDSRVVDALMSEENIQALISVQSHVREIVALKDESLYRKVQTGTALAPCMRCGVRAVLQSVSLPDGSQKSLLCSSCIETVIHPHTAFQLEQSEER